MATREVLNSCVSVEDDSRYSKEELKKLHSRIDDILKQLPIITGRSEKVALAASRCNDGSGEEEHCSSSEETNITGRDTKFVPLRAAQQNSASKRRAELTTIASFDHEENAHSSRSTVRSKSRLKRKKQKQRLTHSLSISSCETFNTVESNPKRLNLKVGNEKGLANSRRSVDKLDALNFNIHKLGTPIITNEEYWTSSVADNLSQKQSNLNISTCTLESLSNEFSAARQANYSRNDEKRQRRASSILSKNENIVNNSRTDQMTELKQINEKLKTHCSAYDAVDEENNNHSYALNDDEKLNDSLCYKEKSSTNENDRIQDDSFEDTCSIISSDSVMEISKPQSIFNQFVSSNDLCQSLNLFKQLCKVCKIKSHANRVRTIKLLQPFLNESKTFREVNKLLGERMRLPAYSKQNACTSANALVIGAGPCGLRTAVECSLLGAQVVLIEKRMEFSRTNCIYLWNFVIEDLISLGANHLGGKLTSSRNSTSADNVFPIALIQNILLKMVLLLGVSVIVGVEFLDIVEPEASGLRGYSCLSKLHKNFSASISERFRLRDYTFDALFCASGQNLALPGGIFREKHFDKKSIQPGFGITANFCKTKVKNDGNLTARTSTDDAILNWRTNGANTGGLTPRVTKLSKSNTEVNFAGRGGGAMTHRTDMGKSNNGYIHDVKGAMEKGFFQQTVMHYDLDKLYFIMTANAYILKHYGAILHYYEDDKNRTITSKNIDCDRLADYATSAANYATHGQFHPLTLALNKNGEPDVSLFYCSPNVNANHAGKILETENGFKLYIFLVGDSLIHPFWKTGSGLAKGFMSVYDATWVFKSWIFNSLSQSSPNQHLNSLALQESLYLFLKSLQSSAIRSHDSNFSIDPSTRYKNISALPSVRAVDVKHLLLTSNDNAKTDNKNRNNNKKNVNNNNNSKLNNKNDNNNNKNSQTNQNNQSQNSSTCTTQTTATSLPPLNVTTSLKPEESSPSDFSVLDFFKKIKSIV